MRNDLHEKYREENTKGIQIPADTNSVKNNISVHHLRTFMENGSFNAPLNHLFILLCILNSEHAATKIKIQMPVACIALWGDKNIIHAIKIKVAIIRTQERQAIHIQQKHGQS